jgi:NADH dehydrogenase FAD-containing subunit
VLTAQGFLDYDYLIVGAGIRYNYEAWFGNDRRAAEYTKAHFPPPTSRTPSTSS